MLRALSWLRWRLLLNGFKGSKRRDRLERFSRFGAVVAPLVLVIPFGAFAVGLAVLGFLGGRRIGLGTVDPGEALLVARGVLLFLLALPILVPLGRASHGSRAGSARLLLLPIPTRALHLVESLSTMADPWIAFVIPGLLALPLGLLTAGRPMVALLALVAAAGFLATIVSLSSLTAYLADWLMRDRRRSEFFTLFFVLLISSVGMVPVFFADGLEDRVREEQRAEASLQPVFSLAEFDAGLPVWTRALPTEIYARAVRLEVEGRSDRSLLLVAALLAQAAVLHHLSSRAHRKVLTTTGSGRASRRSGKIPLGPSRWPFLSSTVTAVAAVHARNAIRSVRGRLAIFLPGPLIALIGILGRKAPDEVFFGRMMVEQSYTMLAFGCIFSLYALQAFHLNQFASDRAGLSLNFLAPISERDLVKGKAVGGAVIYGAAVGLCAVCTAFASGSGPSLAWVSVLLGAAATYVLIVPMAAAMSATLPRTADLSKTGPGGNPHGLAVLIGTFATMALSAVPGLVLVLVQDRGGRPGLAMAISALWLALAVAVTTILLEPVSRIVAERRENLGLVAQGR
ncbi:MAG: hypothetical protein ACKVXR_13785 [Planctomycetota bacterium]